MGEIRYTYGFYNPPIPRNNPGNIIKGNKWKGEVDCPGRFECFKTAKHGLRAMFKVLDTYITKHKLRDIESIITRWAPPVENNTKRYIQYAKSMVPNFDPDSPYSRVSLVRAMIMFELGFMPFEYWELVEGYYDAKV